ncbi:MAG: hypothetical protein IPK75_12635 [Acidobacteria bacterium]|nr:hypothetical protein [Acidobacteriota bacterium]
MRFLIALALGLTAAAPARACSHEDNIALFEEQAHQADRCRIEMQVYREQGAECATFYASKSRGETALACLRFEMDLAEAKGDLTEINEVLPRYESAMAKLTTARAKMRAAEDMLPQ